MGLSVERIARSAILLFQSGLPVAIKMCFTLACIKLIVAYGEAGSLAKWGMVQNAIGLATAVLSFSAQSGIAAAKASKFDDFSFIRGTLLALLMCILSSIVIELSSALAFEIDLVIPFTYLLLAGFFGSLYNFLCAYLPVLGRLSLLTYMNACYGFGVVLVLYFYGMSGISEQAVALIVGYVSSVSIILVSIRRSIIENISSFDPFSWSKYRFLISFGVASFANSAVASILLLTIRPVVLDYGGITSADYFEASIRVVSLIEASVGSVIGILLWRRFAASNSADFKVLMPFLMLAAASLAGIGGLLIVFGDYLIDLLFSPSYREIYNYFPNVIFFSALKIFVTIVVAYLYLIKRLRAVVLSEIIYLSISYIVFQFIMPLSESNVVGLAINSLIIGILVCFFVLLVSVKQSKAAF